MRVRPPSVAGAFYPAGSRELRAQIQSLLSQSDVAALPGVLGGLVPHAGYVYSGPTAAAFFASVSETPETVAFCASVHVRGVHVASLDDSRAWSTPLGDVEPDRELAAAILEGADGRVVAAPEAHDGDHAVEVQLPFVQVRWPAARFLALAVPADDHAPEVGRIVGEAIRRCGRRALVVASSDLTHYGDRFGFTPWGIGRQALERAHGQNDVGLLERLEALDAEGALERARRDHCACGGGAIAATWTAARVLGASSARVLAHTSSSAVTGEADADISVGYAAAALLGPPRNPQTSHEPR